MEKGKTLSRVVKYLFFVATLVMVLGLFSVFTENNLLASDDSKISAAENVYVIPNTVTNIYTVSGSTITGVDWDLVDNITTSSSVGLVLPSSISGVTITAIGENAFLNSTRLASITLPNTITTIGDCAFRQCSALGSIDIPSSVSTIGMGAFLLCEGMTSVTFAQNSTLEELDILVFALCTSLTQINIPSTVETIGGGAFFNCSDLTSITIPSGVTSIEEEAFEYCYDLISVTIPSGITRIERRTFYGCNSLTSVTFSSNNTLTYIGDEVFTDCGNLNIVIPSSVTSIGSKAFYAYGSNVTLTPGTVLDYVGDRAFYYQASGDLTFGSNSASVYIGDYAFSSCDGITSVTFNSGVTSASIGSYAFSYCKSLSSIENVPSMTVINAGTFMGCSSLIEFDIPDSVGSIGYGAFIECDSLVSLTIPSSVENIYSTSGSSIVGMTPFAASSILLSISIPRTVSGIVITEIAARAFRSCEGLQSVTFAPDSAVTTIGDRAFQFCYNLHSVNLSSTAITRIEDFTFDSCPLGSFVFPQTLTYIGEGAFIRTGNITSLPNSVRTIGDYAFAYGGSKSMSSLPSSLTTIGAYAFYQTKLNSLTSLPASVSTIDAYAFMESGFASSFALAPNNSLWSIGAFAFNNCGLKSIVLSYLGMIGGYAFGNNDYLTVYTDEVSRPSSWNVNWNPSNRPVFWGCHLSLDYSYVCEIKKTESNPSNPDAPNGITNPIRRNYNFGGWYEGSDYSGARYNDITTAPDGYYCARWDEQACVTEGTLITLADGSHVAVENLTGEESLLVWNLATGQFDEAPILFVDSEPYTTYDVVHLQFSDGTEVEVIDEHAFWDATLNQYVFLRTDAAQYIGHWFSKQEEEGGVMIRTNVQLVDVNVYAEQTTAWSPVTFGHLCFFVNDMLSMPGATRGLINIFEVDGATMSYDEQSFANDVATYGLFTYEEFAELIPVPEEIFEAFNGQYLKVSLGKGLISVEELILLVQRYADFFV